ncbi:MAG TPA: VWA domain-containing protein [Pyrinomonadaceae bacterium]|nr:VWA domain-containing protein [Pyrinomonadaceae bacterium]
MKPPAALLLIILSALISINAQDGKKTLNTFDVETNLLVFDDKEGYVSGVKQSDIKVFEGDVEQKLTSFKQLEQAFDVVIVADNTGSVRSQLDDIANIGKIIVANLRAEDNAQLIRFVGREQVEILQAWTNKKADLYEGLDNMYVEAGPSAVLDALYLASEDLIKRSAQTPNRRFAVVLISDGEDRNSYYAEKDLFKLLDNSPAQIFTITLTKELPKSWWGQVPNRKTVGTVVKFVNKIAAVTGGTSFILREKSTKDDVYNSLRALLIELRSQYVIKYISTNVTKDNNVRKLTVTVADGPNGEKRKAYFKDTIVIIPPK